MNTLRSTRTSRLRSSRVGGALFALTISLGGCAAPVPRVPDGFVLLDDPYGSYTYRATTADGVVCAVRYLDHEPRGDLPFWVRAIENEMRGRGGYALLETKEIRSKSGVAGKRLRFGHDEASVPHEYWVAIYVTDKRIFVFEAGGPQALLGEKSKTLEETLLAFEPN